MEPKTLEALKASIAHHEEVRDKLLVDKLGPKNCALCAMFNNRGCLDCPVAKATGKSFCRDTPYHNLTLCAEVLEENTDCPKCGFNQADLCDECKKEVEEFRRASQREIDFLRSLLPKEEATPNNNTQQQ